MRFYSLLYYLNIKYIAHSTSNTPLVHFSCTHSTRKCINFTPKSHVNTPLVH